jgi:hypothetical protein
MGEIMTRCKVKKGICLLLCMIFLCIFTTLAVSTATLTDTGLQNAENTLKADNTRACAESGLDVLRFWLNRVAVSGLTPSTEVFAQMAASFQNDLSFNGITNITPTFAGSTITIPDVTLNSQNQQSFCATITEPVAETIQLEVTGKYGQFSKTIIVEYKYTKRKHTVFDYGVATKGPLSLAGNIELDGINVSVESDVYIESNSDLLALSIIGNSQIAGDVEISNPSASVLLMGGQAGIGGETGQDAIDNHVDFGVPPTEFPEPNPDFFEPYVQGNIDMNNTIFENVRIPADTNPTFAAGATLKGITFIETPNIVNFAGHVDVIGIIVGDGDFTDDSGTNSINFGGTVSSSSVATLPEEFGSIRELTGTFLMVPGFSVSFGGNFGVVNGAIAANGITFHGNAGGEVHGSILNYGDVPMTLSGTSDLLFNRTDAGQVPAGFVPEIVLEYVPDSYTEPAI